MNISTHMINKDSSYYKIFRGANTKESRGKTFQSGLKMIHIHTRTREEMIVMERSLLGDINMWFISVKSIEIFFCILKNFTFGMLFKGNVTA